MEMFGWYVLMKYLQEKNQIDASPYDNLNETKIDEPSLRRGISSRMHQNNCKSLQEIDQKCVEKRSTIHIS
jgi:hypothetical protein